MNRTGLCECGCGQVTTVATKTNSKENIRKGEHRRFIIGHNFSRGKDHYKWKGGKKKMGGSIKGKPYVGVLCDGNYVYEHILVAKKALGKPLPLGVEVHHVDGDHANNVPANLIICNDHDYHMLLHQRTRAVAGHNRR